MLSYEKQEHTELSTGKPIRIGTTTPKQPEQERVVILTPASEAAADKIEKIFDEIDTDRNTEFRLAILARISQKLMQESKK